MSNFFLPTHVRETLSAVERFLNAQGRSCAVVGGVLRDQLLARQSTHWNIDLAVDREALTLGGALAERLHGAFVPLDEAAGSVRIVIGAHDSASAQDKAPRIELDLNDYRAPTLEADLALRDFTVNALAAPLVSWLAAPEDTRGWIDPLNGRADLAARLLKPCFSGTFLADPLRVLRAGRFMAQLSFTLEPSALALMRSAVARLAAVSGERVRDELILLLETDRAHPALEMLNAIEALDVVLPELSQGRGVDQGDFHHLDVLGHQLEAVRQGDRMLADFAEFSPELQPVLSDYCRGTVVDRRTRKGLIKLGSLLHDIGKPSMRQVHPNGEIWFIGHEHTGADLAEPLAERLCLSNRESNLLVALVRNHLRPGFLSREAQLTRRAVYRFYKDLGEDGPACLLMWWCDRMATRGKKSRVDQIDQQRSFLEQMLQPYFFRAAEVIAPPRLVDGNQLMQALSLKPGPMIGKLLGIIEEAQAEGLIHTPAEALSLAKDACQDQGGSAA